MSDGNADMCAAYVPSADDFRLKNNQDEIGIDTNFASQSFWKEVFVRYFRKISAVVGLAIIVFITIMAVVGPGMNSFSYSDQNLIMMTMYGKPWMKLI